MDSNYRTDNHQTESHRSENQVNTIYDPAAVEQVRRQRRIDPHCLKRLRYQYFRGGRSQAEAYQELLPSDRVAFRQSIALDCLQRITRVDSQTDGATRLLFRTSAGESVETVILRAPRGRTTVCVSSQVGCAVSCQFCATGYLRPVSNLAASEIVDQVAQANQLLIAENRRIRNVVFMGMGEPFHNEREVGQATQMLHSEAWFGLSARRTMVSTVGIPAAMLRWSRRFPRSPLAISLHSVDQRLRESLIPAAERYPLPLLRRTMEQIADRRGPAILIEYLLLRDTNDHLDQADALARFLEGLPVHVNLIPYNTIASAPHLSATPRSQREAFGARLRVHGFTVTIRYSQGRDIAAACGQLAAVQNE
ncbi:MAG: 23S rRNA (adenine(2503)-C(2))-methyltransferase RlmN [Planctomycetota bacterium]|nr:23S rRNA (adenine(2503)-C(2))-methyltransferase RlmN [Planctomycetota bacterium]